jgi:flagellar basal body-associated protein FliL
MDNGYTGEVYDDGGKRRTIIIASVVAAVVIIGIVVLVVLVMRARSVGGLLLPNGKKTGSLSGANQPSATSKPPVPSVDRNLTDAEKQEYGYPVSWTVRLHTIQGNLGPRTVTTVTSFGTGTLKPSGVGAVKAVAPKQSTP